MQRHVQRQQTFTASTLSLQQHRGSPSLSFQHPSPIAHPSTTSMSMPPYHPPSLNLFSATAQMGTDLARFQNPRIQTAVAWRFVFLECKWEAACTCRCGQAAATALQVPVHALAGGQPLGLQQTPASARAATACICRRQVQADTVEVAEQYESPYYGRFGHGFGPLPKSALPNGRSMVLRTSVVLLECKWEVRIAILRPFAAHILEAGQM